MCFGHTWATRMQNPTSIIACVAHASRNRLVNGVRRNHYKLVHANVIWGIQVGHLQDTTVHLAFFGFFASDEHECAKMFCVTEVRVVCRRFGVVCNRDLARITIVVQPED